jgi:hypothetical protein
MTLVALAEKNCDFDGSGKILHQIREQIAALLAPKATLDPPSPSPDFRSALWTHRLVI